MTGTGQRVLAVKKLDPGYSGTYGAKTGKDFCWTCHNTTAATSAGYISTASWNASTGTDHKTYFPTTDAGHNKSTGAVTMDNPRVPHKENIACKGCHSEHGSTNSQLIAEQVNGAAATFDNTTNAQINGTYNAFCRNCHSTSGLGGPYWPGNPASGTSYVFSGHGSSTKTRSISYSPPVPAKTQTIYVGVCKQCHNPHGTQYANYTLAFEEDLCYQCHAAAGPGRLLTPGNFSIQRQFTQGSAPGATAAFRMAYNRSAAGAAVPLSRHPVLDTEQNQTFTNITKNTNGTVTNNTATTGAIECLNCHNPHLNGGTTPSSLYWKVLDADVQPGQAGYPTALRAYATTNTLVVGGVTRNYAANTGTDLNPDHPAGIHGTTPYNPVNPAADVTADSIKFCLACHDNTVPTGTSPNVLMGTTNPPMNIAQKYLGDGTVAPIKHGSGDGSNNLGNQAWRPRYPYQGTTFSNTTPSYAYAAIQCTTCHDAHGSQNVYFLREYIVVDGVVMNDSNAYLLGTGTAGSGAAISIPTGPAQSNGGLTADFYGKFCGTCHSPDGKWTGHNSSISGNVNTPSTETSCDGEHRWSRYQGGTDGIHDNAEAIGSRRSW
jgi:predicted CXXCH cytochrome family protein